MEKLVKAVDSSCRTQHEQQTGWKYLLISWLKIYLEQNDIKITLFHFNSHLTQRKYEGKLYSNSKHSVVYLRVYLFWPY